MMRISVSDIVNQVNSQAVFLEGLDQSPDNDITNPPFALFFRSQEDFLEDAKKGWFFMRVWFLKEGYTGYLRDTKCPFIIEKDIPLEVLWGKLCEFYTLQKIASNPITMNPSRYQPAKVGRLLDLVYDKRNPTLGYYSKKLDNAFENMLNNHEETL